MQIKQFDGTVMCDGSPVIVVETLKKSLAEGYSYPKGTVLIEGKKVVLNLDGLTSLTEDQEKEIVALQMDYIKNKVGNTKHPKRMNLVYQAVYPAPSKGKAKGLGYIKVTNTEVKFRQEYKKIKGVEPVLADLPNGQEWIDDIFIKMTGTGKITLRCACVFSKKNKATGKLESYHPTVKYYHLDGVTPLTPEEIELVKTTRSGGRRTVFDLGIDKVVKIEKCY